MGGGAAADSPFPPSNAAAAAATTRRVPAATSAGGLGCPSATAASTKPGIPNSTGPKSTVVRIPTGCGAYATVPSASTTGAPNANAAVPTTRNGHAVRAALPSVFPTTGYGRISYVSTATKYDGRNVYRSPSNVDAAIGGSTTTYNDGYRRRCGAF